jgi:hypothetical protein
MSTGSETTEQTMTAPEALQSLHYHLTKAQAALDCLIPAPGQPAR